MFANISRVALTPFLFLGLLFASAPDATAEQSKLLRFPAVHGEQVVFTHGGDLWAAPTEGGVAWRLTAHPGLELFAKFSPDGQSIAFTGQYSGDEQVYVMPATGGEPRQLTWYPAVGPLPPRWGYDNQVYGWTPEGDAVLFRSQRDAWGSSSAQLFTVDLEGGLPEALPMPMSGAGTFTDDNRILYSPLFRDFRTWKRYQGGWAQDLWLFDLAEGQGYQLTDDARTERDPMWIGSRAYFVSDRDGTLNLYRIDPDSGETEQLTFHEDFDVRWASAGPEGQIVYEHGGLLRLFDTRNGADRGLDIHVPDDGLHRRARLTDVSGQIYGYRLSPTGQRVLFEARGDLFSAPVDKGVTRNLTGRSTAHDREADWSPDGQTIVFVSDISGEEEIYTVPADGSAEPRQLTDGHQTRFYQPRFSPSGEHIAVSDKDGHIYVLAANGRGGLKQVARDEGWRNRDYVWSPDGAWLAFSLTEPSSLRSLHVYSVGREQTHRLSEGLFAEYAPAFSPDGQHLYFLADREFAPQISGREWNFATNRVTGIYAFLLASDTDNPFAPEDAEEPGLNGDSDNGNGGNNDRKDESKPTRIDFDGLADRLVRVPVEAGNYSGLAVAREGLLFGEYDAFYYGRAPEAAPRLKLFKFEDHEVVDFASDVRGMDVSMDARRVLVRSGGWKVYDIAREGKEPVDALTQGLKMYVDPVAEWATIFDEVWRRFRDFFYVENMHGYDWEALREHYRPQLEHVAHRSDLNYLMGEMIAELNVSHAYVGGGDERLPQRPGVALLGARFEKDRGRYRIARILDGQNDEPRYRSPLTAAGLDLSEGDYILAINGTALSADDNIYRALTLPAGQAVVLTVAARADGRDAREVLVKPISDETSLHYLAWVVDNHRRVSEASDGRVGYLHVPDMGPDGIREFIKWFYGQIDKQGLVIDVRSNGGGNVSQMLIERLARRPLALGYSRTQPNATTYPYQAFNGHMAAILDENSASDGDIFPWQFRNAGLGPLIGKKSWGGVVGITSHGPVIDGGSVNVPEFGFLNTAGEWAVEGEGVTPDIEVENDPASLIAGEDPQLERAIQEVLRQIEADPPRLPARPAPPVKID